jgi:hypothetical protein
MLLTSNFDSESPFDVRVVKTRAPWKLVNETKSRPQQIIVQRNGDRLHDGFR